MMNPSDQLILKAFADRVRQYYPEARIWAYGSRARGDASPESDLDICVVVNDSTAQERVQRIAWEVGFAHGLVIVALCYDEAEFTSDPRRASPLIQTILREGVVA